MSSTSVVHLVWGPFGDELPRRFVESYLKHPAGADHELTVLFNGVESSKQLAQLESVFDGIEHQSIQLPEPVIDLEGYRIARAQISEKQVLFCNSYTRFLADGWLQLLVGHFADPTIGLVAASGSYESLLTSMPQPMRTLYRPLFKGFPNAHVRTNCFVLSREAAEQIHWPVIKNKTKAWALENGRRSLYRRVTRLGLRGVIAGRDGRAYDEADWPDSGTFRSGSQHNLIASDRRTEEYLEADAAQQAALEKLAWGTDRVR